MIRYMMAVIFLFLIGSVFSYADRSCEWHRRNGGSAAHYNRSHDRDGDGIGCEGNPGAGRTSTSGGPAQPTRTPFPRIVWATPTLPGVTSIAVTPTPTLPVAMSIAVTPTAAPTNIPSNECSQYRITLKYRSNFRARAGTQWDIVGVANSGTVYCSRLSIRAVDGFVWYHVRLPNGWGWIRGDLVAVG